jgi:hypothetical protein
MPLSSVSFIKIDTLKSMPHLRSYMEICTQFLNSSSGVEKFDTVDTNKIYWVVTCFAKIGVERVMF